MKRLIRTIILILFLTISFQNTIFSQESVEEETMVPGPSPKYTDLYVGLKFGVGMTKYSLGDFDYPTIKSKIMLAWEAAIDITYMFKPFFGLKMELGLTTYNSKIDDPAMISGASEIKIFYNQFYVLAAPLIKFNGLYFYIGPYIGFRIKLTYEEDGIKYEGADAQNIGLGFATGIGYIINLGKGINIPLGIEFKYNFSEMIENMKQKAWGLFFTFGITFDMQ